MASLIKAALISSEPRRTVAEVAEAVGTSYNVLNNVLNGRTRPKPDLLESLRRELGMPKGWPYETDLQMITGIPMGRVTLMGRAGAGVGVDVYEAGDSMGESISVPANLSGPDHGGLVIEGDSMYPLLHPGDVAVFRRSHIPRLGVPCCIRTGENRLRVKLVKHDGEKYVLHSLNPAYPPESNGHQTMVGYLVGIYRQIGSRQEVVIDESGIRP